MKIEVKNSPHQGARPAGIAPSLIVLHADVAADHRSSVNWIMDPRSKVSYHAIIGRDGSVTQLVPDERRAWHCGTSSYGGVGDVNDFSIGICLSNWNDGKEPYTAAAILSAVELVAAKMRKWSMAPDATTIHCAVAQSHVYHQIGTYTRAATAR